VQLVFSFFLLDVQKRAYPLVCQAPPETIGLAQMPQEMDRSVPFYSFWMVWTVLAGSGCKGCSAVHRLRNKILL